MSSPLPSPRGALLRRLAPWVLASLLALVPFATRGGYAATLAIQVGINAIVVLGLALLMGYAGQVSLGHAAFFGIGGYASAILTTKAHWPPFAGIAAGMVLAAAAALVVGAPALRLRGHYLAMFTLGLGIIVQTTLEQARRLTNGFDGISGIPPIALGSLRLTAPKPMYAVVLVALLGAMAVAHNLVRSRHGRALRALHESEEAAAACGVDVGGAKLRVFALSAALAALAGSLYAHAIRFVSPDPFSFRASVMFVVMMVVGGSSRISGPLLGALLFTVLQQALDRAGRSVRFLDDLDTVLFGLSLLLVVLFCEKGLAGLRLRRAGGETAG